MKINIKLEQLNEGKFQLEGLDLELEYHTNELLEVLETGIEAVLQVAKEVK